MLAVKKESLSWKALRACLRPFAGGGYLAVGFCFLYVLALSFNVPQYLINAYLDRNLPQGTSVEVGKISGPFPFAFCVQSMHIGLTAEDAVKTEVTLRDMTFRFHLPRGRLSGQVADVVVASDNTSSRQDQVSREPAAQALKVYETLCGQVPKLVLLNRMQTLDIRAIREVSSSDTVYRVWVQTGAKGNKKISVQGQINERLFRADFVQGVGAKVYEVAYRVRAQKHGRSLFQVEGELACRSGALMVHGKVLETSVMPDLEGLAGNLTLDLEEIPTFLKSFSIYKPESKKNTFLFGNIFCKNFRVQIHATTEGMATLEAFQASSGGAEDHLGVLQVHLGAEELTFDLAHEAKETALAFHGSLKSGVLTLGKVCGRWRKNGFSIPSMQYSIGTKQLAPCSILINQTSIKNSLFSFDPKVPAPNTLTFPARDLITADQRMDFGRLTLSARVDAEVADPKLVLTFSLQPQKRKRPSGFVQTFGLSTWGKLIVSKHSLALKEFVIESGEKAHCEGELDFRAVSWKELGTGLKQMFCGCPPLQLDRRAEVHVHGYLRGTLSLEPITICLSTGDRILGHVKTDIWLEGTLARPQFTGPFTLSRGYFENVSNGIILKNVSLQAEGEGDQMTIQALRFTDGTSVARQSLGADPMGTLHFPIGQPPKGFAGGHGSLRLWTEEALWAPILTVRLHCNTLQVAYSKLVKGRISGDLLLEGPLTGKSDRPMVTGEATVDGMLVTVATTEPLPAPPETWRVREHKGHRPSACPLVAEAIKVVENKASSSLSKAPIYRQFALDVAIRGEHVLVQDEGLHCALRGMMRARGPLPSPYLVGTMEVDTTQSATYEFMGKRLEIVHGRVTYDETALNDPLLDVVLKVRVGGKDVFATLSGRLSRTVIALRSNPPMSNEEILSLFLFGQGISSLSPNQNVQVKTFASQMFQGENPLGFLDKLRGTFGLDSLEILETQDLSSGETKQSVRLGKAIKKAKIYVGQDLSSKSNSKVTLRYDLTPEIGLEANLGTLRESSGVGVQWMRRY